MWSKPESQYAQTYLPTFLGGATGAAYTALSPVTNVNVWTPPGANDRAYNHGPLLWRSGSRTWLFFTTHDTNEDQQGVYIRSCYSDDNGDTWSAFITAVPAFEAMSSASDQVSHALGADSVVTTQQGKIYFICGVQTVTFVAGAETARVNFGVLATELTGTTFGTPGFVSLVGAPLIYSVHSDIERINTERYARGRLIAQDLSLDMIEAISFQLRGRWVRLARGYGALTAHYMYSDVSTDGITWSTPLQTVIPNSPSRLGYVRHSTGKYLLFFNPQDGALNRNPLAMTISTDGQVWSDGYTIRSVVTDVPVYAGLAKGGGCSYVHAVELADGKILCAYSIAKEKIEVSRFSLP